MRIDLCLQCFVFCLNIILLQANRPGKIKFPLLIEIYQFMDGGYQVCNQEGCDRLHEQIFDLMQDSQFQFNPEQ